MSYKTKLNEFNQTKKYENEIEFLSGLLPRGKILDYGCGTGTGVIMLRTKGLNVKGYDVKHHSDSFEYEHDAKNFYNGVYFMHSLAHIFDPFAVLRHQRRWLLGDARVVVITPNADWLESKGDKGYKPDKTVISHFNQYKLEQLFISAGYSIVLSGQFGQRVGGHNERLFLVAKKDKYKNGMT